MKIEHEKVLIQTSKPKRTQQFKIRSKDMGKLLGFLRDTLYKNPIIAICREVSCNARDANREVGKADVPIQIKMPTKLLPELHIIDSGPGIDSERMFDILINYGASTKLDTNDLTGGFGLGAKSPFSYTDTFSVITVTTEGNKSIKRHYNAIIDDTQAGRIDLNLEYETDEPSGTKVIIPVKKADTAEFTRAVIEVTKYWKVKPEIIGNESNYNEEEAEIILRGNDWHYRKTKNFSFRRLRSVILIDDIPYEVQPEDLGFSIYSGNNSDQNNKRLALLDRGFYIEFPVGELSLAISRDNIHFDKKTQQKIFNRLDLVCAEFQELVKKQVASCKYLNEAEIKYKELYSIGGNFLTPSKLKWKDVALKGVLRYIEQPSSSYCKGNTKLRKTESPEAVVYNYVLGASKLNRVTNEFFEFKNNLSIFVNDKEYSAHKLAKLVRYYLETNSDIKAVDVLNFKDQKTYKKWKQGGEYLKYVKYGLISKLPEPPKKERKGGYKRRNDFDAWFVSRKSANIGGLIHAPTLVNKDSKVGGVYILTSHMGDKKFYTENVNSISVPFIISASKLLSEDDTDHKIYIIRKKDAKYLNSNWKPLDQVVKEKLKLICKKNKNINVEKLESQHAYSLGNKFTFANILHRKTTQLREDSLLRQYIKDSNKAESMYIKYEQYINLYREFNSIINFDYDVNNSEPIPNLKDLYTKVEQAYPLLKPILRYHEYREFSTASILHYIDLVDNARNI